MEGAPVAVFLITGIFNFVNKISPSCLGIRLNSFLLDPKLPALTLIFESLILHFVQIEVLSQLVLRDILFLTKH